MLRTARGTPFEGPLGAPKDGDGGLFRAGLTPDRGQFTLGRVGSSVSHALSKFSTIISDFTPGPENSCLDSMDLLRN